MDNLNLSGSGVGWAKPKNWATALASAQPWEPGGGTHSLGEKNIALHLKLHCVAQI